MLAGERRARHQVLAHRQSADKDRLETDLPDQLTGEFDRPSEDLRLVVAFMSVPMPQADDESEPVGIEITRG